MHSKSVLISYITHPFKKGIEITHTNSVESLKIAKVFRSLGFNVDVVDFDYEGYLNYEKYDVVFGFGEPLVSSFNFKTKINTVRIYYGTGMHVSVQNNNTLKRIEEVHKEKHIWLIDSARIVEKIWTQQTNIVDAMIVLGNEIVKESYRKYFDRDIFTVPASFYKIYEYQEIIKQKNFDEASKHYLWFGSRGLVHKGLDLLLNTFKIMPDIHLHICGPLNEEKGFNMVYEEELHNSQNIHQYGFVRLDSEIFKELIQKCAFVIYPSCSEGGSPSILNVSGNGGLLPIITKEAGVDVNDFGFIIKSLNQVAIKNSIEETRKLSNDELKRKSFLCANYIAKNNSLENFIEKITSHLQTILTKNDL